MIGLDNMNGPQPSLVVRDIERMQAMLAAGATATDVAAVFGVSTRTVYRYKRAQIVTADVAGWRLQFVVYPGHRPILVGSPSRKGR